MARHFGIDENAPRYPGKTRISPSVRAFGAIPLAHPGYESND
jgi:hypothetical protein